MKLKLGSYYKRRDGKITGALEVSNNNIYPFFCKKSELTFRQSGKNGEEKFDNIFDLIEEVNADGSPIVDKKERKPLAVGDRVRVYGNSITGLMIKNNIGEITHFCDDFVDVKMIDGEVYTIHCKQCRRLKKKAKPLQTSFECVWISYDKDSLVVPMTDFDLTPLIGKKTLITIKEVL